MAGIVRRTLGSAGRLTLADLFASHPVYTTNGEQLVYLAPCDGQCLGTGVWLASATGADRHNTPSLTGWTCGEGDLCVQGIATSPSGGWTEEGTWADPDTGQAETCFQGAIENSDGSLTTTAPSTCVPQIVGAFAVRPN